MKLKLLLTLLAVLALGGLGAWFILERNHDHAPAADHGHDHAQGTEGHDDEGETARGPHGGRLFTEGDFAVELAIIETGVPPEFRAWFTRAGQPVAPGTVNLTVRLTRADGSVDEHRFAPVGDFARSSQEVYEPHSFTYDIAVEVAGQSHRWQLAAPEMQTTIAAAAARQAGIAVAIAGPARIADTLILYGQVKLDANRVARAIPRFGGIVREARKSLGDAVQAGETLAVVETNQTLASLEVKAPLAGTVIERHATAGETLADGAAIYTVADLGAIWVDLHVPRSAWARVQVGQPVTIHADDGGAEVSGTIGWISPFGSVETQTLLARVVLPNPDARWRPGLFVKATLTLGETEVAVAVRESALQTLADFTVVFSQHGELYQARPLELGRRDGGWVEVLKGLRAGERYVAENSFLLKADIGKSGAAHDH